MKLNFSYVTISKGLSQISTAIKVLIDTPIFIKKHRLWSGFLDYKWTMAFSVVIACLFSYTLYSDIHDYFIPNEAETIEIDIPTGGIDAGIEALESASSYAADEGAALEADKADLIETKEQLEGKHQPLFSGSLKFLLLIFLEVLIFHFAVKTNNILKNENKVPEIKGLYKAQMRMIKVMGRKWIYGLLMFILVSIACGITGTDYLKEAIMFLIYGYYLGFAFLDNYLEQYHFSIRESAKCIQSHFGAATVFGIFASLLMNIPLFGPLIVPFLCGIAATRYGHLSTMEAMSKGRGNSDLEVLVNQ